MLLRIGIAMWSWLELRREGKRFYRLSQTFGLCRASVPSMGSNPLSMHQLVHPSAYLCIEGSVNVDYTTKISPHVEARPASHVVRTRHIYIILDQSHTLMPQRTQ